jgi:hypothetical protein
MKIFLAVFTAIACTVTLCVTALFVSERYQTAEWVKCMNFYRELKDHDPQYSSQAFMDMKRKAPNTTLLYLEEGICYYISEKADERFDADVKKASMMDAASQGQALMPTQQAPQTPQ